ncbi:MAG: alkyl hydroperoxide reductase [Gammaproteobacteria bacterium]|nr:alkyl hydroperoxide reductase [Gammaproteobacteria bacterium]
MKKILLYSFLIYITFFSSLTSARYLMDPMPTKEVAPAFNLVGMDEKFHTMDEFKGKFVLVNFWATWCHPCKEEMPTLEAIHKIMDNNKFTVLGIHVGPDPTNIKNFLKISPVSFPIFIDMDLELNWGVPGLPTTFLIDPDGKMIYRSVGKRNFASNDMRNFFLKLIKDYSK